MARQSGSSVENNFIKGLITEATPLSFPENSCTDALNVDFDLTGRITKRRGIDYETGYSLITTDNTGLDAVTEYVWRSVGGDGNHSIFVLQKGRYIYFYDVSNGADVSPNKLSTVLDLDTYKPASTTEDPKLWPCGYTSGNGDLIIVNQAIDPIYVTYSTSGAITATEIEILVRDFRGLTDGLDIDERPVSTVANLITTNPAHYYNLANQGWLTGDALSQWDTALTSLPSNADYIALFRSSATDSFDATIVTSKTGYNTPAPKGHYILNAWQPDRTLAGALDFGATLTFPGLVNDTGMTRIGDNQSTYLYDGVSAVSAGGNHSTVAAGSQWMGNDLGVGKKIYSCQIYGTNNAGFGEGCGAICVNGIFRYNVYLYGKNTAPASATDGTILAQRLGWQEQDDMSGGLEMLSTDQSTTYRYVWVYMVNINYATYNDGCCTRVFRTAELDTYEIVETDGAAADDIITFKRPTTCEFYQGRVFYSGVSELNLGSNVYFSQIVERREQYGLCYQKNDPTSEDLPDLLADDGGFIKIPDAGTIVRLFEFQGALLVLATNGVWIIQGSAGSPFLATDYEVRKISSSGTNSPLSIASFRGVPVWWGREGVHTVNYDPNYSSFTVDNISNTTIQSLVDSIPNINKKFVKGACDPVDRIVYWLYNDSESLGTADQYKYNSVLCLNMQTTAFFPYEISSGPDVRGAVWVPDNANNANPSKLKFTVSEDIMAVNSTALDLVSFADMNDGEWTDWPTYATSGAETAINYSALTKREDASSNEAAGYDGTTTQAASGCVTKAAATSLYYGYSNSTAASVSRALVWGSSDQGYVNGANPTITMRLYGKTGSAPASGTDGTSLAEITFTDATGDSTRRELISSDSTSTWDHVWIYISQSGGAASMYFAEAQFFKKVPSAALEMEYDASFTTGYRLDGQTQRDFQTNYVMVFLEAEDEASLFGQAIFDFTNTGNSGRWSALQQLYNSHQNDGEQDVIYKKIKARGQGKSCQIRFEAEGGKPFTVIGWNIWVTANAAI